MECLHSQLVDHRLRDQADAVLRTPETLGIELRIVADNQALRDHDTAVDDHVAQERMATDLHIGKNYGILQTGI
ncbi:hypothetical protein D9M70_598970 [compost metagenome]